MHKLLEEEKYRCLVKKICELYSRVLILPSYIIFDIQMIVAQDVTLILVVLGYAAVSHWSLHQSYISSCINILHSNLL